MNAPVVTRFAPSPTGHLHIGGARTALFCWAFARRHGGSFLIRIEDTDQARSSEASARGILEDLAWLGIEWDQGPVLPASPGRERAIGGDPRGVAPFYQSQRLHIYNKVIDEMIERGVAYADFTSADKLDAMRKAATAAKETFKYRPPASDILPPAEQRKRIAAGEPHVVRLRADEQPVRVVDEVLGEVAFGPGEVDDFVLRKADGFPTYHFGVVVDDELMGVTHVLRGQEHLMNTPRHAALQRALGYRTPVYAHMPLIFNDQGAKMSKRERDQAARAAVKQKQIKEPPTTSIDAGTFAAWLGDTKRQLETGQLESLAASMGLALPEVSVGDFRKAGYLPEVICNFIAILGWNPGMKTESGGDLEKFDMDFLGRHFDLPRIGKSNARFDRKKLMSFNADALGAMSDEALAARWLAWCEVYDAPTAAALRTMGVQRAAWLARAVKPRCKTLRDALRPAAFAFVADDAIVFDEAAVKKAVAGHVGKDGEGPTGAAVLQSVAGALAKVEPFTPEAVQGALEALAAEMGLQLGQLAAPVRVAMTGGSVSPGLGETIAVLGRESAARRISRCLERAR
jgi:glutamyl/glutaminyl-tRNA synthetase